MGKVYQGRGISLYTYVLLLIFEQCFRCVGGFTWTGLARHWCVLTNGRIFCDALWNVVQNWHLRHFEHTHCSCGYIHTWPRAYDMLYDEFSLTSRTYVACGISLIHASAHLCNELDMTWKHWAHILPPLC